VTVKTKVCRARYWSISPICDKCVVKPQMHIDRTYVCDVYCCQTSVICQTLFEVFSSGFVKNCLWKNCGISQFPQCCCWVGKRRRLRNSFPPWGRKKFPRSRPTSSCSVVVLPRKLRLTGMYCYDIVFSLTCSHLLTGYIELLEILWNFIDVYM